MVFSNWRLIGAVIALLLSFGAGWYVRGEICAVSSSKAEIAQQQAIVTAQAHVIATQQSSSLITQEISHAFEDRRTAIDSLYAHSLLREQPDADGHLPALPSAAGRACPAAPATSRAYGLTLQQCDAEEAKLISLYEDWKEQAALK